MIFKAKVLLRLVPKEETSNSSAETNVHVNSTSGDIDDNNSMGLDNVNCSITAQPVNDVNVNTLNTEKDSGTDSSSSDKDTPSESENIEPKTSNDRVLRKRINVKKIR